MRHLHLRLLVGALGAVAMPACDSPGGGRSGAADVTFDLGADTASSDDATTSDSEDPVSDTIAPDTTSSDADPETSDTLIPDDEPACEGACALWQTSCAGDNGYRVCAPDEVTGCGAPSFFIACQPGNDCVDGDCLGGCTVPEVILVVDRSSSMAGPLWDMTRPAVLDFVARFEAAARFGVRVFPGDAPCEPGATLAPALDAHAEIAANLQAPATVAQTPIARALDGLDALLGDPDQAELVVLISDGSETCDEVGDALAAAEALRARGTLVDVIGIGESFDAELLQAIARAGGGTLRTAEDAAALDDALRGLAAEMTGCAQPAAGASACLDRSCRVTACGPGQHACDGACVDDDAVATCGDRCAPCPVPANAIATCDGAACGSTCKPGFHDCGGVCVSDDAVASCGARCAPCPDAPGGSPACEDGRCTIACDPGFHDCGGACVANDDVAHCGDRCTPCAAGPNGTPTCAPIGGGDHACRAECVSDHHDCEGACVSDDAVATCGARCAPCPTSPRGVASCVDEACVLTCDADAFACQGGAACCAWSFARVGALDWSTEGAALGLGPGGPQIVADSLTPVGGVETIGAAHARLSGASWVVSSLMPSAGSISALAAAFESDGDAYVVYDAAELTWVRRTSAGVVTRTTVAANLKGAAGGGLAPRSVVVDAGGGTHVFYKYGSPFGAAEYDIFHRAVSASGQFGAETVVGSASSDYDQIAAAVAPDGSVCATWRDGNDDIAYACRTASGFTAPELAYTAAMGATSAPYVLAFDASSRPHLVFVSASGNLYHVTKTTASWTSALVAADVTTCGLARRGDGELLLVYQGESAAIWLVRWSGAAWVDAREVPSPVEAAHALPIDLAFDASGDPWIGLVEDTFLGDPDLHVGRLEP